MRDFLKHLMNFGLGTIISALLGFISTPLITRIIDPAEYGRFNVFNTYLGIILSLLYMGLDQALIRFFYSEKDNDSKKGILKFCLLLPIVCTIILFLLIYILDLIGLISFKYTGLYFFLLLLNALISIWNKMSITMLRLTYKSKSYSFCTVIQKIVYCLTILVCFFIVKDNGLFSLVMATTASVFASSLFSTIFTKEYWNFNQAQLPNNKSEMLKYSLPFILFSFIATIIDSMDVLLVEHFCSDYEAGVYSSAFTLIGIISIIQTTFNALWIPAQTQKFSENDGDKSFIQKGNLYMTILMLFLAMCTIGVKDILCYLLGESYRYGSYYLPFLLVNTVMTTLLDTTSSGIDYSKKSYLYIYSSIPCLLFIPIEILLIKNLGAKGAALSRAIIAILYFSSRTYFSNKYYYIDYGLKKLSINVIVLMIFAFVTTFNESKILSLVFFIISFAVYFCSYKNDIIKLISSFKNEILNKK